MSFAAILRVTDRLPHAIAAPFLDATLTGKRRVRLRGGGISGHPHSSAAPDAPPLTDQAPLPDEIAPHGEPDFLALREGGKRKILTLHARASSSTLIRRATLIAPAA
jgi:hypothetical protein